MVVIDCARCGFFEPIRTRVVNQTSFSQILPCGETYTFTVSAVTKLEASTDSQVTYTVETTVETVENLAVTFIPGKHNGSEVSPTDDIITQIDDKFVLTWDPPVKLSSSSIQVCVT